MKNRRPLALFISIAMLVCYMPTTALADVGVDITDTTAEKTRVSAVLTVKEIVDMPKEGFWSTKALQAAVNNGLLNGFEEEEGTYVRPNDPLTRAQMAAIVNRAFGAQETASLLGASDLPTKKWYYKDMQKAVKMGTMKLDTLMRPNDTITRQEAFTVLGRALKMKDGTQRNLAKFNDASQVASWAASGMGAMVKAGYIKGDNNLLTPRASMTRAQFATIMNNVIKQYITSPGTVTEVASGNVMVNSPGVTLEGVTITGDLIIGDGVGEGTIKLTNVIIEGDLIARGGGVDSIIITGGSVNGKVIIAKIDGKIRVFAEDGAEIEVVEIDDGKDEVIIEGSVGTVEVTAADTHIIVKNANVEKIKVKTEGAGNIIVDKDSKVDSLVVGASSTGTKISVAGTVTDFETSAQATDLSGTGKVTNAKVNKGADNSKMATPGTVITNDGAKGISDDKGEEVATTPEKKPSSRPSTIKVNSINLERGSLVLAKDDMAKLTAKVLPNNAANKKVTWTSSDKTIASVDDGLITGLTAGAVTITAITADGGHKATVEVIIKNPSPEEHFVFNVTTGAIEFCSSTDPNIVIPVKIRGVKVQEIGENAFSIPSLESITIPNTVKTIGVLAFADTNLSSVNIPSSVKTIGDAAFLNSNLTTVNIPDSVEVIGDAAFAANKLVDVTIPSSVRRVGSAAFNDNQLKDEQAFIYERNDDGSEDKTKVVSYGGAKRNDVKIPDEVAIIGLNAFGQNQLTSITIPNSVTTIGRGAFSYNQLTEVAIPNLVTIIEEEAFSNNTLTAITIPDSVTSIETKAFFTNNLTSLIIPNSVIAIEKGAFSVNKLTEVTIPNRLKTIEEEVFNNNDLISVTIPDSVTTIGKNAFGHNNLTSITIPNSVTNIGTGAFVGNGPGGKSGGIPTSYFVGTWQIVVGEASTEWVKE